MTSTFANPAAVACSQYNPAHHHHQRRGYASNSVDLKIYRNSPTQTKFRRSPSALPIYRSALQINCLINKSSTNQNDFNVQPTNPPQLNRCKSSISWRPLLQKTHQQRRHQRCSIGRQFDAGSTQTASRGAGTGYFSDMDYQFGIKSHGSRRVSTSNDGGCYSVRFRKPFAGKWPPWNQEQFGESSKMNNQIKTPDLRTTRSFSIQNTSRDSMYSDSSFYNTPNNRRFPTISEQRNVARNIAGTLDLGRPNTQFRMTVPVGRQSQASNIPPVMRQSRDQVNQDNVSRLVATPNQFRVYHEAPHCTHDAVHPDAYINIAHNLEGSSENRGAEMYQRRKLMLNRWNEDVQHVEQPQNQYAPIQNTNDNNLRFRRATSNPISMNLPQTQPKYSLLRSKNMAFTAANRCISDDEASNLGYYNINNNIKKRSELNNNYKSMRYRNFTTINQPNHQHIGSSTGPLYIETKPFQTLNNDERKIKAQVTHIACSPINRRPLAFEFQNNRSSDV